MNQFSAVPSGASAPTAERIEQFTFTGSAGEYFGIWIVNVLLTIVTFGIYSAWAKVRRNRYFYGHTQVAGTAFDYHARPQQILLGRVAVVGGLIIYNVIMNVVPVAGILLTLVLLPFIPWLIMRGLRFSARVTSFRNLRFDFAGSYGGAAKAFFLGPIIAVLTIGILAPVASRWLWRYMLDNLRYGGRPFSCEPRLKALYGQWWLPALTVVLGLIVVFGTTVALGSLFRAANSTGVPDPAMVISYLIFFLYVVVYGIAMLVYRAGVRNVAVSATVIDGQHRLRSHLSRGRYAFIAITNLLATIATLGLARPWAAVRMARYNAVSTAVVVAGSFDHYVSRIEATGSAVGAEFMDIEGFDFAF
jgi:uncharacterized membrane protein YjgN (DUF898 family)